MDLTDMPAQSVEDRLKICERVEQDLANHEAEPLAPYVRALTRIVKADLEAQMI